MRRIITVLTITAFMVAMIAASGLSASAQSPSCPSTGPSGSTVTTVIPDEAFGAGFICLDEEAQEFFCPPEFELQLFPNPESDPAFIAECVEVETPNNGGGSNGGDAELTQESEQQSEAGDLNQTTDVS